MVELQHPPMTGPGTVFERPAGDIELRDVHAREVAIIPLRIAPDEISKAVGEAYAEIASAMATAGVDLAGPPFMRYFSFGPVIDAEAGFPVFRPAPDVGRVRPGRLPGGRVATIVHVGPYDTLEASYGLLLARVGALGLQPLGPMWEVYWSDPEAEPDPATWRTEILVPVG